MTTILKGAAAPTIKILTLTTCVGDQVDISAQLDMMIIFEDIFAPVLTGNITITDTIGLFDKVPIMGSEQLTIKFYAYNYAEDNDPVNFIHRTFDVLKITNISSPTDYAKRYVMHFASPELKKNETIRISNAYKDTTISNVVGSLMTADYDIDEPLGLAFPTAQTEGPPDPKERTPYLTAQYIDKQYQNVTPNDSVELFVELTKYQEPWITLPYMKPFDAIRWLASRSIRACPGNHGGLQDTSIGFLFFENKRGFQFTSLESLDESYTNNTSTFSFGNASQNKLDVHDGELVDYVDKIERLEIQDCYDTIRNIQTGMYSSRLYTYDWSTGELLEHDFDYIDNFNKEHAQSSPTEYPMLSLDTDGKNSLSTQFMSKRILVPHLPTRGLDNTTNDTTERNNEVSVNVGPEQYLQQRMSYLASLSNYRVLLEVPGNSKHKVGDAVNLALKEQWYNSGLNNFTEHDAQFYSGKYLITSIKHQVTKFEYKMIIEVSKNTYMTKVGVKAQ